MQTLNLLTHRLIILCCHIITATMTPHAPPYFAISITFCDHFWGINLSTSNSSKPTISTCYKLSSDQIQGQSTGKMNRSVWSPTLDVLPLLPPERQFLPAPLPDPSGSRQPGSNNSMPTAHKSHTLNTPNLLQHKLPSTPNTQTACEGLAASSSL